MRDTCGCTDVSDKYKRGRLRIGGSDGQTVRTNFSATSGSSQQLGNRFGSVDVLDGPSIQFNEFRMRVHPGKMKNCGGAFPVRGR